MADNVGCVGIEIQDHYDEAVPLLQALGFQAGLQRLNGGAFATGIRLLQGDRLAARGSGRIQLPLRVPSYDRYQTMVLDDWIDDQIIRGHRRHAWDAHGPWIPRGGAGRDNRQRVEPSARGIRVRWPPKPPAEARTLLGVTGHS